MIENEKDSSNITRLEKALNDNLKKHDNLIKAVAECDNDNVRNSFYKELANLDKTINDIKKQILIEESQYIKLDYDQIKFFLEYLKNGDINDIKYRKMLINVIVHKIYLYDDSFIPIFTMNNKTYKGILPSLEELEDYFKNKDKFRLSVEKGHQKYAMQTYFFYSSGFAVKYRLN